MKSILGCLLLVYSVGTLVQGAPTGQVTGLIQSVCKKTLADSMKKWPTLDPVKKTVEAVEGPHVFWSGRNHDETTTIQRASQNYAKKIKGTTIVDDVNAAPIDCNNQEKYWWHAASEIKAKYGRGVAHVFLGNDLRRGNLWENYEWPALQENDHIKKVVQYDPVTYRKVRTLKPPSRWPGHKNQASSKRKRDSTD